MLVLRALAHTSTLPDRQRRSRRATAHTCTERERECVCVCVWPKVRSEGRFHRLCAHACVHVCMCALVSLGNAWALGGECVCMTLCMDVCGWVGGVRVYWVGRGTHLSVHCLGHDQHNGLSLASFQVQLCQRPRKLTTIGTSEQVRQSVRSVVRRGKSGVGETKQIRPAQLGVCACTCARVSVCVQTCVSVKMQVCIYKSVCVWGGKREPTSVWSNV
jgi:hypothetical protein